MMNARKKIFQPLVARQGIEECCDSLYLLPGDYQGSLSLRDEGKGVMSRTGCHDDTTGLEAAADLQATPQLAPKITKITTNGISVALLAITTGIAIASDGKGGMRVAQNIQPVGINRVLLNDQVTKAFADGSVADTYRGKNPGETHEAHNFTFLACVCEWDRPDQLNPVAPTFGPNNLFGKPKARLLIWDDVLMLSRVLLQNEFEKNTGPPEQGLVTVLRLVNERYNSFRKVGDFEQLLSKLCEKLNDTIKMEDLKCSGIDDVCFLVKIAWASLQLPILGAVSGQTRMLAASHVLQEIEPSNNGKNCVRKKGCLQVQNGETPSSLHSTTAQVEFLIVSDAGCCLTEDTANLIYAEALLRQGQAMRGVPVSFQVVVLGLIIGARHDAGKVSSDSFLQKTFVNNLRLAADGVAKQLLQLCESEVVPIKTLTAAYRVRNNTSTLSSSVLKIKGGLSRHKEPVWGELQKTTEEKKRASIRSVKVEFFGSLVGIEIANQIAKSPYQAFLDFFQHNGSSHGDSAWQRGQLIGVWMHPAKPSETGEYVGEWVQKMKGEATGIWWVSPSTVELKDCELSWTLTLEAGLLRPLACLLTTGLLKQVVKSRSMDRSMKLHESIVREWVYAFLWEVLVWSEGFAVPIPAAWKDLKNLRELLAVVYKDELGLVTWVSDALTMCEGQTEKIFCTNLFGIVAFILGLLAWEDSGYSLSSSFTEVKSIQGKGKGKDKGLLAPECFTVLCPLVVRKRDEEEKLSLFQWLQELLGNSDASNELADNFDGYLCDWKEGEKSNSLVAGLFGNHEEVPNIKETFFLNLSSLSDARKADGNSAMEGFQSLKSKKRKREEAEKEKTEMRKKEEEEKELAEKERTERKKRMKEEKERTETTRKEAEKAEKERAARAQKTTEQRRKATERKREEKERTEMTRKKAAEANMQERNKEESAAEGDTEQGVSSKEKETEQPPADLGTEQEEDKWKRLGVDKWTPESKIIPDPKLKKEILLLPCLDKSAHTEEAAATVQFRKLTLGNIQCYICDFVPVDHLQKMVLFHRSKAFRECYDKHAILIAPYNVGDTKKEEAALKSFEQLDDNERQKWCKGKYYTYYSRYKDDHSYWYKKGFYGKEQKMNPNLNSHADNYSRELAYNDEHSFWYEQGMKGAEEKMKVVDDFMKEIAKAVKAVREKELNGAKIEFREMHGVAITTTQEGSHQLPHVDHRMAYQEVNDGPEKRAYIGHMPLQREGMVLRLENLTEKMFHCLTQRDKAEADDTAELDNNSEVVQDHLYLHIPFGSILLIDDRTFHGGHYGTEAKHRFHFVLSPYDWTPWRKGKKNITTHPKAMMNADKEGDILMFLIQAARFYAGLEPSKSKTKKKAKKKAFWKEEDDPIVAKPRLKTTEHLDLSTISNQTEYLDKRRSFYKKIALELVQNGETNDELIGYIFDNA